MRLYFLVFSFNCLTVLTKDPCRLDKSQFKCHAAGKALVSIPHATLANNMQ